MENFPSNITMPTEEILAAKNKQHIFIGVQFVTKGMIPRMILINAGRNVGITSRMTMTPKRRCRSAKRFNDSGCSRRR